MFVRVKKIGSRRYVYLVEGAREGGRVRQRTLCYLGPLYRLASGVPDDTRGKAERRVQTADWNRINAEIRRVPLTFEELAEARRAQYAAAVRIRQEGRGRSRGDLPRASGELSALARLASTGFADMFERVGDRQYRMRMR